MSNNSKRNIVVIGNGHDLSLGIKSSFNEYIGINGPSDYRDDKLPFKPILNFIKLFHKYQNDLMYKIRIVKNRFKDLKFKPLFLMNERGDFIKHATNISKKSGTFEQTPGGSCYVNRGFGYDYYPQSKAYFDKDDNGNLKLNEDGDPIERSYIPFGGYGLSRDYFVLKLFFDKHYKITKQSFSYVDGTELDPFKSYESLYNALKELNNWGDKKTNELINAANKIHTNRMNGDVNFWNLLLLFEMYIDIRTYKSLHSHDNSKDFFPKTWYDIENTIKEYLISIINQPNSESSRIEKYYMLKHSYHTLDNYINNANLTSRQHFNFFTCINRYIDLLRDIDIKSVSGGNYSNRNVEAYPLYKEILNYSRYNDFLIHYASRSSNSIGDPLHILEPFMFLMLNDFPKTILNGDKSLFNFLHQQTDEFENDFSLYLQHQIGNNKKQVNSYKRKSLNHLKKLSITSNLKFYNPSFSVLDFNYTPLDGSIKSYEHVHGSLRNKDIVIGIGEQAINRLKPIINDRMYNQLYSFTKTYRLFSVKKHANNDFLKNVKNIIFFGHSFGVNDFPYFEALFDHFNLYSNSRINLIFAYCKHGNKSYEDVKRGMVPRIVSLLRDYGQSLSHAHSDNLIARMFMENRIKLYPVHFN